MDKALAELVKISRAVGRDKTLVLGEFGNTSVKTGDGEYMYIKASGTALKDMSAKRGWRRLRLGSVQAILADKRFAKINADKKQDRLTELLLSACDDEIKSDVRPSVESGFHSMLGRYVIHLHPAAVLAYLCAKKGRVELEKLFGKERIWPAWVGYANPGCMLAEKMKESIGKYKRRYGRFPQILFLQNHGLVVTANNAEAAIKLVHRTVAICKAGLKRLKTAKIRKPDLRKIAEAVSGIRQIFSEIAGRDVTVKYFINAVIATVMADKKAAKICAPPAVPSGMAYAITPDELVYAGGGVVLLDKWDKQALISKLRRRVKAPSGFLIKPLGLFVAGDRKKMNFTKDVICTYLSVRRQAARLGGIHSLNKQQRQFIIETCR
jgi:rhamnose utilization protein RhaD (predicted bifunctional aldolase and dehydrogenase)